MCSSDLIRQYTEAEVIPYYDPTVNEYVVRNLVAEGVTTPYISFIDDDAYPSTNWYQNLLRNIRKGCDIITGTCTATVGFLDRHIMQLVPT